MLDGRTNSRTILDLNQLVEAVEDDQDAPREKEQLKGAHRRLDLKLLFTIEQGRTLCSWA
jgi:hypothetical protein